MSYAYAFRCGRVQGTVVVERATPTQYRLALQNASGTSDERRAIRRFRRIGCTSWPSYPGLAKRYLMPAENYEKIARMSEGSAATEVARLQTPREW